MSERLTPQMRFTLASFLLDAEARQLRPATLRYYRQQLTWFLEAAIDAGVQEPTQLIALVIRAYLAGLQSRGLLTDFTAWMVYVRWLSTISLHQLEQVHFTRLHVRFELVFSLAQLFIEGLSP